MKQIFIFFISFSLIFNPSISYSKSIKTISDQTKFYEVIDCKKELIEFNKLTECVNNSTLTSQKLGLLMESKKAEIYDIIAIANILNESVKENFISNNKALSFWNNFLDAPYKGKLKKKELSKILNSTGCKNNKEYFEFINCFNDEFRDYDIYINSNIKTKERMEHIIFNSLILTKPDGFVYTLKKENIYGVENFDKLYEEGDGFEFFFTLMSHLGTNYFKKPKSKFASDVDWERVVKFIVIALITAIIAKKILKTFSKKSYSNPPSSSAGNTATQQQILQAQKSGLSLQQSLSIHNVGAQPHAMKNLFKFAPPNSFLHSKWFKISYLGL